MTYTIRATDSSNATDDQTVVVKITGTNDAPVVDLNGADAGVDAAVSMAPDTTPHYIFSDLAISDAEGDQIQSADVIYDQLQGGAITYVTDYGVTASVMTDLGPNHDQTGLHFSGPATASQYATLLQGITFQTPFIQDAVFKVVVNDGTDDSLVATSTVAVEPQPDWDVWTAATGVGGDWTDGGNWSLGYPPGLGDHAYVDAGVDTGMDFNIGSDVVEIEELYLQSGSLNLVGDGADGTFLIDSALINYGTITVSTANFDLPNYVLNAGHIEAAGPGAVINFGTPLASTVENSGGVIAATDGGQVYFTNVLVNYGEIDSTGSDYDTGDGSVVDFLGTTVAHADLVGDADGIFQLSPGSGTTVIFDGSGTDTNSRVYIHTGTQVVVNEGTTLELIGTIQDAGTIVVDPVDAQSTLAISGHVTLNGGGNISLLDEDHSVVTSADATLATLTDRTVPASLAPAGSAMAISTSTIKPAVPLRPPPALSISTPASVPSPMKA